MVEEILLAFVSAVVASIASKVVDTLFEAAEERKASKRPELKGKHAKRP